MISIAGLKKSHCRLALVVGLLFLAGLGCVLLTGCLSRYYAQSDFTGYDAETLLKYKTAYVGDNSKVVNLISNLPYADRRREVALQTGSVPYGVTVDYDFSGVNLDINEIKSAFRDNAVIMFALIDNVDVITFVVKGAGQPSEYQYLRTELQTYFDRDLREYSKNVNSLETLLKNLTFKLYVYPEKYTPAMSSKPGIRIATQYRGSAAKARYVTDSGSLFTWEASTGKMTKGLPKIELPLDIPVCWSPLSPDGQTSIGNKSAVTVTLLDEKGQRIDEKRLTIVNDGFYTVEPSIDIVIGIESVNPNQKPLDMDDAASLAIKSRSNVYGEGETATEGHIILDSKESNGKVKVYTIASFGAFGFENGIFTKVSGSGAIPTVMTFSRDENGGYSLLEYKEPEDGAGYAKSIKKMFPQKLQDRVLSSEGDYADLVRQQETQAAEYLKSIGRTAEVSATHVDKKLADINVEASNKLFAEYTKYDSFLNNCPYWIGTRERIENGARYIYETSQEKTGDGQTLIVFKKTGDDGVVVEERRYKIVGDEPQLMESGDVIKSGSESAIPLGYSTLYGIILWNAEDGFAVSFSAQN
jgi:hypothetical protein